QSHPTVQKQESAKPVAPTNSPAGLSPKRRGCKMLFKVLAITAVAVAVGGALALLTVSPLAAAIALSALIVIGLSVCIIASCFEPSEVDLCKRKCYWTPIDPSEIPNEDNLFDESSDTLTTG
ncbi:MAG: hypothetical protein KDK78_10810, partial [Chlamydiia bacterium]|nr:hypothetical protein [Chlamydiia bacterium]